MRIQDSDYIFLVTGDASAEQHVVSLMSTLQDHGFRVQARPGSNKSVLVFARLTASAYAKVAARDLEAASEFGVTARDDAPADRGRLVYSYLTSPASANGGSGVGLTPGKGQWVFVAAVVLNSAALADKSVAVLGHQAALAPSLATASLLKTHGTQVAMYFEFLKFYIVALGVLAVLGAVAYAKAKTYSLTYALVTLVWGTVFLILWKKKERALANSWGVQNAHMLEQHDAGLVAASAGSGEKSSPAQARVPKASRRFIRELAFVPLALVFVAILVLFQLACFVLEIFLAEIYDGPLKVFLKLVPTVLLAMFVPVLTAVYNAVVDRFLAWEGHANYRTRYDSFVVKTFTLNFLTGYVPLLITSFIYLPFAHFIEPELPVIRNLVVENIHLDRYAYKFLSQIKSQLEFTINQARLDGQFFFYVVTNQLILFVLRYVLPLVLPRVLQLVNTRILGKKPEDVPQDAPEERAWLASVRRLASLPEHNIHDDYRGLCLQFGYLVMFGPVWTLAPLLSLVFNVLTFKLDTWRFTCGRYFRPPVPKRVDSIHPWDTAFFVLAWIGSIVSPVVSAFYRHGTHPPKQLGPFALDKASVNVSSSTFLWLTLFASEHLFFALYLLGTKAASLFRSPQEVENSAKRVGAPSEMSRLVDAGADRDWEELTIEQIKALARGSSSSGPYSEKHDIKSSLKNGILSGVEPSATGALGENSLNNRAKKLEELERKKAQLERVKHTLEKKQLEEQAGPEDTVISTVDSQGNKIQAIIDGNNHIDMSDVHDIERKLSRSSSIKKSPSGLADSIEKQSELLESANGDEKDFEPEKADGTTGESLEETSSSTKPSKRKSIKRLLKRA